LNVNCWRIANIGENIANIRGVIVIPAEVIVIPDEVIAILAGMFSRIARIAEGNSPKTISIRSTARKHLADVRNDPADVGNHSSGISNHPSGVSNHPVDVRNTLADFGNTSAGISNTRHRSESKPPRRAKSCRKVLGVSATDASSSSARRQDTSRSP
jgi:hypothetical protein